MLVAVCHTVHLMHHDVCDDCDLMCMMRGAVHMAVIQSIVMTIVYLLKDHPPEQLG